MIKKREIGKGGTLKRGNVLIFGVDLGIGGCPLVTLPDQLLNRDMRGTQIDGVSRRQIEGVSGRQIEGVNGRQMGGVEM